MSVLFGSKNATAAIEGRRCRFLGSLPEGRTTGATSSPVPATGGVTDNIHLFEGDQPSIAAPLEEVFDGWQEPGYFHRAINALDDDGKVF